MNTKIQISRQEAAIINNSNTHEDIKNAPKGYDHHCKEQSFKILQQTLTELQKL